MRKDIYMYIKIKTYLKLKNNKYLHENDINFIYLILNSIRYNKYHSYYSQYI